MKELGLGLSVFSGARETSLLKGLNRSIAVRLLVVWEWLNVNLLYRLWLTIVWLVMNWTKLGYQYNVVLNTFVRFFS